MVIGSLLDPVLNPLLELQPWLVIVVIAFVTSLFITVIYKYTTDQKLMKNLKEEMKAHQQELKKHKSNPQKMMEIQKRAMEKNMQYMIQSFRPMLFYFLPLIIIFGWLNAHLGYYPINPYDTFTTTAIFSDGVVGEVTLTAPEQIEIMSEKTQAIVDGKVEWRLRGEPGEYRLDYTLDGRSFNREVFITSENVYKSPVVKVKDSRFKELSINNQPIKALNLFGWRVGWLGAYIIFSLIFGIGTRKILRVY